MHICMTRDNLRKNEISYTTIMQYLYPPQTEILATRLETVCDDWSFGDDLHVDVGGGMRSGALSSMWYNSKHHKKGTNPPITPRKCPIIA